MNADLHQMDFYAWTRQQAALLKAGQLAELDIEHLSEEIEGMGARERRELINRLAVLLAHLLKWELQPTYRGRSWQLTIKEQRRQLQRLLDDNPSLKSRLDEFIPDAYGDAVIIAAKETGLEESGFPAGCPYDSHGIMDAGCFPGD
jgi:hypothetical protein